MPQSVKTYAVILAGGRGERFWPQSRRSFPKQFLFLFGSRSLIQMTSRRIAPVCPLARQRFVIDSALSPILCRQVRLKPGNLIIEPRGRNTAPALALAAAYIRHEDPDSTMVVLPADHLITKEPKFRQAVRRAIEVAQHNYLVTFGIPPTRPDTNYGYIEVDTPLTEWAGKRVFRVKRFREKPGPAQARAFLRQGTFWWNSGMFVWRTDAFLAAVQQFMPDFYQELCWFRTKLGTDSESRSLERLYRRAEAKSVDYAIMERARNVAVIRADFDWDDVGSWTALERHFPHDRDGNTRVGETLTLDARRCLVLTDKGLVALLGCTDLVIVRHQDALLVAAKKHLAELKRLLAALSQKRRLRHYL